MSDLLIPVHNGRRTTGDPMRIPPGFLARCENWVYSADDNEALHKIHGRSVAAAALPGASNNGMVFLRYDNGANRIVVYADGKLYEATTGVTLGAFAVVQSEPPADFALTGAHMKALPDSLGRMLVFTSGKNQRPLVRDEDGNWRFLGMFKPEAPVLDASIGSGGKLVATANRKFPTASDPATTSQGVVTNTFGTTNHPKGHAYDVDKDTYAACNMAAPGVGAVDFGWAPSTVVTENQRLTIILGTSSLPIGLPGDEAGSEPLDATLIVQKALDVISGTPTYVTIFSESAPVSTVKIQERIAFSDLNGGDLNDLGIRVMLQYRGGSFDVTAQIMEIWCQDESAGDVAPLPLGGTFYYAVTEVYSVTLASQKTIVVESSPSETFKVVLTGGVHSGAAIKLPPLKNLPTSGMRVVSASLKLLRRKIHRTTRSGVYPNLASIVTVDSTVETYIDNFEVGEDTLGADALKVVFVGPSAYNLSDPPPSFKDACNYQGAIVAIPAISPHEVRWSSAGQPDYWPFPQSTGVLTQDRNDEAMGVTSLGDWLILFLRNRVLRTRDLPQARSGTPFNPPQVTILSPSEGLAGSPLAYCHFHSQKGHALVAWVSDSGIWATDGTLLSERGLGVIRLTSHKDWGREVDRARLTDARLTFDPVLQALVFDHWHLNGSYVTEYLHVAAHHWIESGQDQAVPKFSGPHALQAHYRAVGEDGGVIRHWALNTVDGKIYLERTGTDNAGSKISSVAISHWGIPGGPRQEFQVYGGTVYHSDWGAGEACDVEVEVRRDQTGIRHSTHKRGLSLRGERLTELGWVRGSGQSARVTIRHLGKTTSTGEPRRALGPIVLEGEAADEVREG